MSDNLVKRSPDDFDWPATIFLYVVVIILGIGMCFCLRKANRLIPNRFSFPLVDRGERSNQRGFYDLGTEEEGLLSRYSDVEDEDDAEVIDNQNALHITPLSAADSESEHEQELQDIHKSRTDYDDDELYHNPYRDSLDNTEDENEDDEEQDNAARSSHDHK